VKGISRARLNRIEARAGFADDWPGPVIQVLVTSHDEASQSRELDDLLNTGQGTSTRPCCLRRKRVSRSCSVT
jgi:hypothetical protein